LPYPSALGSAVRRARPVTLTESGALSFGAVVAASPSVMEHVFPVECFCIARQMLSTVCQRERGLGRECRFSTRRGLSPSRLGAIPAAGWQRAMVAALARQRKSGLASQLLAF
jgi:hypothetical protein